MKKIFIFLFVYLFCSGCQNNSKTQYILEQWIGKKIIFPSTLQAKFYGKDTITTDYLNKKYKVVMHVDSSGCSECKLGLYKWAKFINEYEQYNDKLEFIFVAHVINHRQMAIICRQNQFKHIIYYDPNGEMDKINKFIKDPMFRCFLVDDKNQIQLIGNPFYSKKLMDLYKQKMKEYILTSEMH